MDDLENLITAQRYEPKHFNTHDEAKDGTSFLYTTSALSCP